MDIVLTDKRAENRHVERLMPGAMALSAHPYAAPDLARQIEELVGQHKVPSHHDTEAVSHLNSLAVSAIWRHPSRLAEIRAANPSRIIVASGRPLERETIARLTEIAPVTEVQATVFTPWPAGEAPTAQI